MSEENKAYKNPWLFVPTLYFTQGIPFILVNQLSVAMFKSMNADNVFIGLTSFLYIPWSIKFLWGPFVDSTATKRSWLLMMQLIISTLLFLMALIIQLPSYIVLSLILLTVIAFSSATQDIAMDGFYLFALNKGNQALFAGIRSAFYRLAMLFAGGLLVSLAGILSKDIGINSSWSVCYVVAGLTFAIIALYHKFILPKPLDDLPVKSAAEGIPFGKVFKEYFNQEKIGIILSFILLYRLGEGLMLKMAQPFLLDKKVVGGLGLTLTEVGIVYGTIGVIALVIGGIAGGWFIKKYGLKRLIIPLALCIHLPNLLFVYMAAVQPDFMVQYGAFTFHPVIQLCIFIEQFGYGLGFTSFTVYLLYISRGKYKTSHYAISTGFMAIGMMVPGFLSGWLQQQIGYFWLFIVSSIATIPGFLVLFFLPFTEKE